MKTKPTRPRARRWAAVGTAAALAVAAAAAGPATVPTTRPTTARAEANPFAGVDSSDKGGGDLAGMGLEDLMNVEVTSVAKQPQKASETPAAVTVIGPDDISRSGLQSIPELLRLAPGMDVAQLNANTWAVGTRGFNDPFSNKLQVLTDGRSSYTPAFSGVFWDMQQPILQDVDRIEVIRGPGATLYGSNAVDGVVNITTKSARDTQGVLVTGLMGTYGQNAAVRYGGQADDRTYYRVYGRYQKADDFASAPGDDARDGWQGTSAGFRLDRYATADDTFTLQADAEQNRDGQRVATAQLTPPYAAVNNSSFDATGANVLGRWTHRTSDTSELVAQAYYDFIDHPIELSRYRTDTGDLYIHDRFAVGDRQELIVGGEYRFMATTFRPGPVVSFVPPTRDDYLASTFVQDDVTVVRDRVHLVVGTKLEETSVGGFDVQPSGRVVWTADDRNTVWAGVSRAVRTPSEWEKVARLTPAVTPPSADVPAPTQVVIDGSTGFRSETLAAYEFGYRVKPAATVSVDLSGAYNHYGNLRSYDLGGPQILTAPVPHLVVPSPLDNDLAADTYAVEVAANWQVTPAWRLAGSYSLLVPWVFDTVPANAIDVEILRQLNGSSPVNQAQLHSYWDVTKTVQVNASVYFVDKLTGQGVPSYVRTDLNLVWRPRPGLDLTVGVQNLVDSHHPEFNPTASTPTLGSEVPRTVYGQVTYRF